MAVTGKLDITPKDLSEKYVAVLRKIADDLDDQVTVMKQEKLPSVKAMNQPGARDGIKAFRALLTSVTNNIETAIGEREKESRRATRKP